MLISELENLDQGTRSFLRSNFPIDLEFKSLLQAISLGELESTELLYDSSALIEVPQTG